MMLMISHAINDSLLQGFFPDYAKNALVSPLDKVTFKKNEISHFQEVRILTSFLRRLQKGTLKIGADKFLFPFLSPYRQHYNAQHLHYNAQHLLIHLIEKW